MLPIREMNTLICFSQRKPTPNYASNQPNNETLAEILGKEKKRHGKMGVSKQIFICSNNLQFTQIKHCPELQAQLFQASPVETLKTLLLYQYMLEACYEQNMDINTQSRNDPIKVNRNHTRKKKSVQSIVFPIGIIIYQFQYP